MRSGAKYIACAAGIVGVVALAIIKRDAVVGLASGPAEESHAARFARGAPLVVGGGARRLKIAESTQQRSLTPCPHAQEESSHRVLEGGSKRASRKNDNDEDGNMETKRLPRDDALSSNGRTRNKGETFAEAYARTQLQLRPKTAGRMREKTTETYASDGFPYRYPAIRYLPWSQLSSETRDVFESEFGYNEASWNTLSHDIENKMFTELDWSQQQSLLLMGIDGNVWDCFFNHYASYHRNDLVDLGIYDMVIDLWNTQSSKKKWHQLSEREVEWATRLCFSEEVWNDQSLGTW